MTRFSASLIGLVASESPWREVLHCETVKDDVMRPRGVRPAASPTLLLDHPRLQASSDVEQVKLIGGHPHMVGIGWSTQNSKMDVVEACRASVFHKHTCSSLHTKHYKAKRTDYQSLNVARSIFDRNFTEDFPGTDPCTPGWQDVPNYKDSACFYNSPPLYFASLDDLHCNSKYLWRVKGEASWRQFTTPPCVGQPIDFGVVADLGQTNYSADTIDKMISQFEDGGYQSILFPGDLSYANGYHPRWDTYGILAEPLFGRVPTSYGVGNHEQWNEMWLGYESRYPHTALADKSGSNSQLWYSYDAGLGHIVNLCSYCNFSTGSDQHTWLMNDLRQHQKYRRNSPWLVFNWHTPWYTSNVHHDMKEGSNMRMELEETLHNYGADIVITGHVHAYERTYPVYQEQIDECGGITHITVGDGGNRECFATDSTQNWNSFNWSANKEFMFGHGRLRLYNHTHAEWQWYSNDDYPAVGDSVVLVRGDARPKHCSVEVQV